ncbi:MAG: WG repeat-containing protein [Synergistaceae bacterium]|nr:WG repeat-containing protein [Synergistaceae bacterium]
MRKYILIIISLALSVPFFHSSSQAINVTEIVIPFQFQDARPFSDGMAAVKKDGKWGYIDRLGQWVIEPGYAFPVGDYSSGLAYVGNQFLNTSGVPAFEGAKFENARAFSPKGKNALAAVQVSGQWGFIDLNGQFVISPKYDNAGDFTDGGEGVSLAPVKVGGIWVYVDKKGRELIMSNFDYAWNFAGEFAAVMIEGSVGYINRTGLYAINPQFIHGGAFYNGRAPVRVGNKTGYINDKGRLVIPAIYHDGGEFSDGLAPVATDSRWGYINVSGSLVIPPLYDNAKPFSEGLAAVEQDGLWGYISYKNF